MKGVRTMFGRLFLSTGSDTFAGAKAKSFAPSPHLILYTIGRFKQSHAPSLRQKTTSFFCTGGSRVKKQRVFSAPEAHASKNNGFFLRRRVASPKKNGFFLRRRVASQETVARFLRRRVACQKTMAVFCAAGLHVKKRWPFSVPQGCKSKNDGRFLRCRVASQKNDASDSTKCCI